MVDLASESVEVGLMGTRPPYLFGSSKDDLRDSRLELISDIDTAMIEMAVRGRWDRRLCLDISSATRKCFAEHPSALIIDLSDLSDPDGASMPFWLSERRAAAAQPAPVHLVLCIPPTTRLDGRLRRVGAHLLLPMFATMAEARLAVGKQSPMTDMLQLRLFPEPAAQNEAAHLLDKACQAWDLPRLLHPARAIMTQLVGNAVEHAGTTMLVTVSRRGAGLHLSVHDGDPRLPRLLDPAPGLAGEDDSERGQGLRSVHAEAVAWGAMPTRVGKVVWATVRHRNRRPN
jgi:hypothetical protein